MLNLSETESAAGSIERTLQTLGTHESVHSGQRREKRPWLRGLEHDHNDHLQLDVLHVGHRQHGFLEGVRDEQSQLGLRSAGHFTMDGVQRLTEVLAELLVQDLVDPHWL